MNISTLATAREAEGNNFEDSTVVVIDVLRATSTIITALNNGAERIFPTAEIDEALTLAASLDHQNLLLCGERNAGMIPGFDLGNSPLEFTPQKVSGKQLIMTTTNGTKAIRAAMSAKRLLLASFINAGYMAEELKYEPDIVLLCSGTNGRFSMDDALCAGLLADLLMVGDSEITACDLTLSLSALWKLWAADYVRQIKNCRHGKLLMGKDKERDIDHCLSPDLYTVIPSWDMVSQSIIPLYLQQFDQ